MTRLLIAIAGVVVSCSSTPAFAQDTASGTLRPKQVEMVVKDAWGKFHWNSDTPTLRLYLFPEPLSPAKRKEALSPGVSIGSLIPTQPAGIGSYGTMSISFSKGEELTSEGISRVVFAIRHSTGQAFLPGPTLKKAVHIQRDGEAVRVRVEWTSPDGRSELKVDAAVSVLGSPTYKEDQEKLRQEAEKHRREWEEAQKKAKAERQDAAPDAKPRDAKPRDEKPAAKPDASPTSLVFAGIKGNLRSFLAIPGKRTRLVLRSWDGKAGEVILLDPEAPADELVVARQPVSEGHDASGPLLVDPRGKWVAAVFVEDRKTNSYPVSYFRASDLSPKGVANLIVGSRGVRGEFTLLGKKVVTLDWGEDALLVFPKRGASKPNRIPLGFDPGSLQRLAFDQAGKRVAIHGREALAIWDLKKKKVVVKAALSRDYDYRSAFSANLARATLWNHKAKTLTLWDLRSVKHERDLTPPKEWLLRGYGNVLAMSPGGKYVAAAMNVKKGGDVSDLRYCVWRLSSGKIVAQAKEKIYSGGLPNPMVAFSADGKTLYFAVGANVHRFQL